MSSCDCQKNIKKPINDRSTIDATVAMVDAKPIEDGLLITTIAVDCRNIFLV